MIISAWVAAAICSATRGLAEASQPDQRRLAFLGSRDHDVTMRVLEKNFFAAACLMASALLGCTRGVDRSTAEPSGESRKVADDVKDIGKATQKAAKDIGHASVDLADKAGRRVEDVTNKAAEGGQDAWITTKVKGALTAEGLDALHLHVDTKAKVVTLSGSVDSTANRTKAVGVARGITGVVDVIDHLFVNVGTR